MPVMEDTLEAVVALAARAPSIFNTRPWIWRGVEGALELYADEERRLPVADPAGHQRLLSCGASLHHAQVGARALGWRPTVTLLPDPGQPLLLARIALSAARPPDSAAADLHALHTRHIDRRAFSSWPVPDAQLLSLADLGRREGAQVVPVTDESSRSRTERLTRQAAVIERDDARYADEEKTWLGSVQRTTARIPADEYGGLLVIGSTVDDPEAWLRSGAALSAIWLSAGRTGLSVIPASQVIEIEQTRRALARDVTIGVAAPHLLVRVGWPPLW